jgi:hypothetical protein
MLARIVSSVSQVVGHALRLLTVLLAWGVGTVLAVFDGVTHSHWCTWLSEAPIDAIQRLNPENTLRWLWTIYHGVGWALISMAIVTFTGVMRRD